MRPELKAEIERREVIIDRIVRMLIDLVRVDRAARELDPDTPLFGSGLALDSMDAIEIVVALRSEFGLALEEPESRYALRTINTMVDAVIAQKEDAR